MWRAKTVRLAAGNGLHFPYCNNILVSKRGVKPLFDRLIKESSRRSITSQHSGPHLDTLTPSYSCVSNKSCTRWLMPRGGASQLSKLSWAQKCETTPHRRLSRISLIFYVIFM